MRNGLSLGYISQWNNSLLTNDNLEIQQNRFQQNKISVPIFLHLTAANNKICRGSIKCAAFPTTPLSLSPRTYTPEYILLLHHFALYY